MPSLRQIKTKISSVKGTKRIMSAMKLISAVKLQRVQGLLFSYRPYSDAIRDVAESLATRCDRKWHPLLRKAERAARLQIVFMTSDRGLCGSFNSNLIRKIETFLVTDAPLYDEVSFRFVGRRGRDHFVRTGVRVTASYTGLNERTYKEISKSLSDSIIEEYSSGSIDEVLLVYNHFVSALNQVITFERLLPIEPRHADSAKENYSLVDYLYEP
ncbi:MAG: F0F1 ATP synthase subunit gamma, partial [Candidatus Methanosuratincola sp.]